MGIYDKVRIDRAFPEHDLPAGSIMETKNLYAGMAEFYISLDGRLIERRCRFESDPDAIPVMPGWPPPLKRIYTEEIDIDYHGDLCLYGYRSGAAESNKFVMRFTHGQLEWICPFDDYPKKNQDLLMEQGAR